MLRETDLLRVKLVAHTLLDPLQLLLAQATPLISSNPYSGYDSLQKQRLYAVMDDAMHSYQESEDENALSEKEMVEEMSEAPSMQM